MLLVSGCGSWKQAGWQARGSRCTGWGCCCRQLSGSQRRAAVHGAIRWPPGQLTAFAATPALPPPCHLPRRNTAFIYIAAEYVGGAIAAVLAMVL